METFIWALLLCFGLIQCSTEFDNGKYIIQTSQCTIPDIPVFSPVINVTRNPKILCSQFDPLLSYTSVVNNTATLHIRKNAVEKYFGSVDSIECCYSYVSRVGSDLLPDVGFQLSECVPFQTEVDLQQDTVWISCKRSGIDQLTQNGFPTIPVYENVHHVIRVTDSIMQKTQKFKETSQSRPISVLMVVIDSVSRLNFIRTMPETRNFILKNGFYEFIGYNKVGDNTYPNAMALLTGLNLNDAYDVCQPGTIDGLMNCPFIWYTYRDFGYATAYGEDWARIATFNYQKMGFRDPPTDYYLKPYMDAIEKLPMIIQDYMPFCSGPESQGDRILNAAYDFANNLKNLPKFGVFWMNTFSHNEITSPMTMDTNVREFFEKLKNSDILDENIVILISDHGVRFGDRGMNATPRGYYEVRLPMNYISLPGWFKQAYPEETRRFEENTKKLTSDYDVYMTLQNLLVMSGANYSTKRSLGCPSCRSLFDEIPTERSCYMAGIPQKWCTCNLNITELFP